MFSTIVHPTEFSEESIPALNAAHKLAKELRAKLLVCFMAHPPLVASGTTLTDPEKHATRNIAEELESFQPSDTDVSREIRVVVTEQSTRVKTLLGFLQDMECDLLVLGMHNRTGIAGWLGSSITEEVVRRAECAVLVVKHHEYEYESDEETSEASAEDGTASSEH